MFDCQWSQVTGKGAYHVYFHDKHCLAMPHLAHMAFAGFMVALLCFVTLCMVGVNLRVCCMWCMWHVGDMLPAAHVAIIRAMPCVHVALSSVACGNANIKTHTAVPAKSASSRDAISHAALASVSSTICARGPAESCLVLTTHDALLCKPASCLQPTMCCPCITPNPEPSERRGL